MATHTAAGFSINNSEVSLSLVRSLTTPYHLNDAEKSTHHTYKSSIQKNTPLTQHFIPTTTAQHKTLLSTLYSGQDKYILDVWKETDGTTGETVIKTLSNADDTNHFVFIRDADGKTYTYITEAANSYVQEVRPPITPTEVYAATPSRVLKITDSDNFAESVVFTGTYEFGSVCDTTDLENQLNTCLQEKADLQQQLSACQNDLAQAQSALAACQQDLTECQNTLTTCQGDLTTCNANLNTCTNDLNTCTNNLTTCQNTLQTCNDEKTQLQNNLSTCNGNLSICQNTVADQQDTIDNLNQQITDLQNQIVSLQTQLTDALSEIATLQDALDDCRATSNPYVPLVNYSITEKSGGILVHVESAYISDLYLFVKQKSTGEIVKSVRALTSSTNHVIFIPVPRGDYIVDYLALKPMA